MVTGTSARQRGVAASCGESLRLQCDVASDSARLAAVPFPGIHDFTRSAQVSSRPAWAQATGYPFVP